MIVGQVYIVFVFLAALAAAPHINAGRRFVQRYSFFILLVAIVALFASDVVMTLLQHEAWANDDLSQFLLPEYQEGYFYFYVLTRFFANHLLALAIALVFLFLMLRLNKRGGGMFFEREEPYVAATSIFLVGHPGWMIYMAALVLAYLVWHAFNRRKRKEEDRLPLYNLWALIGLVVFIFNQLVLQETLFWAVLKI